MSNDCIELCGKGTSGRGYKTLSINGKRFYAHRLVAMLFHGLELQDTRSIVLHSCDNPKCINPQHLSIGTARDNVHDCIAKGRFIKKDNTGEKNPRAKLTWRKVSQMRNWSHLSYKELAEHFEISESHVSNIMRGFSWKE